MYVQGNTPSFRLEKAVWAGRVKVGPGMHPYKKMFDITGNPESANENAQPLSSYHIGKGHKEFKRIIMPHTCEGM